MVRNIEKLNETRYNKYLALVERDKAKGYITNAVGKQEFIRLYDMEHTRAINEGDPKRSLIRIIARQSVEMTVREQKRVKKQLQDLIKKGKVSADEFGASYESEDWDRGMYFDALLYLTGGDYDTSRAQYNDVFGDRRR